MRSVWMWVARLLSAFWKSFCIFIVLFNRCNLCAKVTLTSALHLLYFSHRCSHWLLWYCVIAMLSLVKVVAARANRLRLDCIFASSRLRESQWCDWNSLGERVLVRMLAWFPAYNRWLDCAAWPCLAACLDEHTANSCTFLLS